MLARRQSLTLLVLVFAWVGRAAPPQATTPIALDAQNPHYFSFRGQTTALVTSGEHYGAVLNADFDYSRYLEALAEAKLNYARIFGGSYVEVPSKSFGILHNDLAPQAGRFVSPWAQAGDGGKFDLDRWNPEFFRRYRGFLAKAAQRGIVVEVTLFSSYYADQQWEISPLNPANNVNRLQPVTWKKAQTLENGALLLRYQGQYVRKLVREAADFDNVIFEIQNEPYIDRPLRIPLAKPPEPPPAQDRYPKTAAVSDAASVAWQTRVAAWIASEEAALPHQHLIAENYSNFVAPVAKVIPGVSVINFHYAFPAAVLLNYGLGKAIAYDESGFLGSDDAVYRRQAWNFMLAGGATFNNLDYSFSVGHEDGSDLSAKAPGGGSPALRKQLAVLAGFVASLPLRESKPDDAVVRRSSGAIAHVLSKPGHVYAMYLDGKGPGELTLVLPAGRYQVRWLNPATGESPPAETFEHSGGEHMLKTPVFEHGIAVRLDRSAQ